MPSFTRDWVRRWSAQFVFALAYLPRAQHVLRTEGPRVLWKKLRRRLNTTPALVLQRPDLVDVPKPLSAIGLAWVGDPDVSIVIPVFNQWSLTHRCLAALGQLASTYSFEVVLVDDCSSDGTAEKASDNTAIRLLRNPRNLGFVDSCNVGARGSRGRYLVFLNNDTQVQAGWLDALIGTFEHGADVGLVGSRLIYPNGRQQEAGAILFADGSAWNYGHLDDPHKPQYSYLREVDYCSGAALAIPRTVFEALGGFDRHFVPAYYEDADLAMRVRAAGYRVFYQPLARVVHFEGATAGTDRGPVVSGMKRFQAVNREKFLARWGQVLAAHGQRGEDLERAKERRIQRRAFVVDNYMLTPDRESGSLRMVNLFSILQGLGYKVTFAAANLESPEPYVSRLQMQGVECLYRPYTRSISRHLAEHGRDYDLAILSRADAAARAMPLVRRHCPNARVVFDTVDLHFLRESRLAELTKDRGTGTMAERRKAQELALIDAADATLVVSETELELLRDERPQARLHLVSNIHRIFGSARAFEERQDILFIGAFAHPPNTDAVLWLAREILPRVWAELPNLHCHVIGADPSPEIRALGSPKLTVHGYVSEVVPFFTSCRLSVAPLRYGAGVKGKINQSLSHGLPVVATPQAAEGMYLVSEESALIAADPSAFAAAIVRLSMDPVLWGRISTAGLQIMERHFGFEAARRAMREVIDG